ncbi:hypothetical protein CsSME_00024917 [Camellia sinensis var. sinensis]
MIGVKNFYWFSCGVSLVHNFLVLGDEQILFGFVAQYTIMPSFGWIISKTLGLPPAVSVGLILLACCPGGNGLPAKKRRKVPTYYLPDLAGLQLFNVLRFLRLGTG